MIPRISRFRLALSGTLVTVLVCQGCHTDSQPAASSPAVPASPALPVARAPRTDPLPSYSVITRAWNARVQGLDRFYARLTWRVRGFDADRQPIDESAEGHLQILQPRRVSVIVSKVGSPVFYIGSDDDRYWLIDRSVDPALALVGRHDSVTLAKTARLGVFVHPLDLLELLGISPLDPEARPLEARWSATGQAVITIPARFGFKRLWLDLPALRPTRIELFSPDAALAARADLADYESVSVRSQPALRPSVATELQINVPMAGAAGQSRLDIRMRLFGAEARDPRAAAFDYPGLKERAAVGREVDLDVPARR